METIKEKSVTTFKDPKVIKGNWKLTYKLVNPNGEQAFSGKAITAYADPLTQKERHLTDANGRFLSHYWIGKTVEFLDPTNKPQDRKIVDWLIGHPDVGIERSHAKSVDAAYFKRKNSNPRIRLVNLDHQNLSEIDNEEFIDELVGQISMNSGVNALSTKKLRFILCYLNMPYFDSKYYNDQTVEKKFLRRSLKTFVRSSIENARKVKNVVSDLTEAQYVYEIREMVRKEILEQSNGMYKYRNTPLGVSMESVVKYFTQNKEVYEELSAALYEALKEDYNR